MCIPFCGHYFSKRMKLGSLLIQKRLKCKTINPGSKHSVKSVRIWGFFWSLIRRIRTEYRQIQSISSYSVRMQECLLGFIFLYFFKYFFIFLYNRLFDLFRFHSIKKDISTNGMSKVEGSPLPFFEN